MAHDPMASSRVMAQWLAATPPSSPVLLVDDHGPIADWLDTAGTSHRSWQRYAWAGGDATAWPPEGPFETVAVRLPKGREAQRMVLHAVAARLSPGGVCYVHGRNDEGIKSAKGPCGEVFERVETVETKRKCRVWRCEQPTASEGAELDHWAVEVRGRGGGVDFSWLSWPGLFAHGQLDGGTKLLLRALPRLAPRTRVLDFASGAGAVARGLLTKNPGLAIDLLDVDALAVHAAKRNIPEAGEVYLSDAWSGVPAGRTWDLIVSNPPWHAGVSTDWAALKDLIRQAPKHLNPGGSLWMVTQRNVRVQYDLEQGFPKVRVASATPGFRVWHASR